MASLSDLIEDLRYLGIDAPLVSEVQRCAMLLASAPERWPEVAVFWCLTEPEPGAPNKGMRLDIRNGLRSLMLEIMEGATARTWKDRWEIVTLLIDLRDDLAELNAERLPRTLKIWGVTGG